MISTFYPRLKTEEQLSTACIVMPTYNEAENVENILEEIFKHEDEIAKLNIKIKVLVVDDNSPDGTADIVEFYMATNRNGEKVELLLREKKEGLGAAYIAGMKHALNELDAEYILEMDADGQHDPEDIYRLLVEVKNGHDFVIGSRYVEGGHVPENWSYQRRLISTLASSIVKTGLGLKGVEDCSGGFRAIKSSALKSIDLDNLNVKGYAFQAALLEAIMSRGFSIKEIPIDFGQRENGESKMGISDMIEGWKLIYLINAQRMRRWARTSLNYNGGNE